MLQPLEDRLRRQQPDPRRGQLDGQRQAVKPAHDLGHRSGVPLINGEAWHRGRRPLGEQPHRFTRSDGLRSGERILLRDLQRRNRALLLARHAKRRAAAHHDPQSARWRKQLRHHRRGRQQVLEVVQDQQELAILQITGQVLHQRRPPGIRQADALGDRRGHQSRFPDRRQPDEIYAIGIIGRHLRGELNAQARLAAAARSGQREQAAAFEEPPRLSQLPLPADETRQRPGQAPRTAVQDPARGRA